MTGVCAIYILARNLHVYVEVIMVKYERENYGFANIYMIDCFVDLLKYTAKLHVSVVVIMVGYFLLK